MIKKYYKIWGGILVFSLVLSIVSFGSGMYNKEKIQSFDFADVYLNGELGLSKNQGYIRAADGQVIPSSLNWDGTTYVPLRVISELLGAQVGWNGSVTIDLKENKNGLELGNFEETIHNIMNVEYKTNMIFDIKGGKAAFIEDATGMVIEDLDISVDKDKGITITNAYRLSLKESYVLTILKDDQLVTQPFYLSGITLNSFEKKHGVWYTVIPADEASGFSHPVIIGFSNKKDNVYEDFERLESTLIVEGSNEGVTNSNNDSYSKQINERMSGELSVAIASHQELPFMISMFPRPLQDGLFYSHALDRDTLFNDRSYYDQLGRGNLFRMDTQFLSMMDYTKDVFEEIGLNLEDEVGIAGFSASSDWANRMTMLYPEKFKFVVANLTATMPMETYEGHDLPYPLGLSNIDEVTGSPFNSENYATVPMFWFVGGNDLGDGSRFDDGWGNYGNYANEWNQEGIDYRAIFGEDPLKRRKLQMTLIHDLGFDKIEYISYPGLEHGWGNQQLVDIDVFLDKILD